jgi:hypothetical protein
MYPARLTVKYQVAREMIQSGSEKARLSISREALLQRLRKKEGVSFTPSVRGSWGRFTAGPE